MRRFRQFRYFFLVTALLFPLFLQAADPIRIDVDASDAPRNVLHAHLTIPVKPGPLTLYYPKWIPGEHGPTGPIVQMANLHFTAGGNAVTWDRDSREMYAFRVIVPAGATELAADLDFLNPAGTGHFSAGGSMSPKLAIVSWNQVLLYPATKSSEDVMYQPTLKLPSGWQYATALATTVKDADVVKFDAVNLTHLIDSPVLAGQYMKKVELKTDGPFTHTIDLTADSTDALVTPDDFAASYGRLVNEARALFGAEHYRHYDWLVTLSDNVEHFGLEHHESSDDRTREGVLREEATRRDLAGLLSHEYMHSWNGKFRRPAGLAVSNYDVPMTGELLWVYEGLTQYLGKLLAYRSRLWSPEYYREALALTASTMGNRSGRSWRPLEDTAVAAQFLYGSPTEWRSARRSTDFYDESVLLWLDTDMTIRKLTNGQKSLDDFCRRFHGGADGDPVVKPYTFDEVVKTLNEVAPNDWATFLRSRIRSTETAPLGGIEASGWRLVWNDTPNVQQDAMDKRDKGLDASTSLGLYLAEDGSVKDVIPPLPAGKAGITPGSTIRAVNGRKFTTDRLVDAIRDAKGTTTPIQLIVEQGEFVTAVAIDYHGGLRYPHLERVSDAADLLETLGKPLAK